MISIEIYRIFAQSRIYVRRDSWIEIANDSVVWHIDNKNKNDFINDKWLSKYNAKKEGKYVEWYQFNDPFNTIIDGLSGDGKRANKSGIGATVRIKVGDNIMTRHVESATGEGNQNDLTLHFGFGELKADSISAEVTWPGNYKQTAHGLNLNATHTIHLN